MHKHDTFRPFPTFCYALLSVAEYCQIPLNYQLTHTLTHTITHKEPSEITNEMFVGKLLNEPKFEHHSYRLPHSQIQPNQIKLMMKNRTASFPFQQEASLSSVQKNSSVT